MSRAEVLSIKVGDFVQEQLGTSRRPTAKPQWGRPREVLRVERIWKTRKGWTAHFRVAFGGGTLSWTAIENDKCYRTAVAPTAEEIATWAAKAEKSPDKFSD